MKPTARDLQRLRAGDLTTLAEVTGGASAPDRALVSQIDRIITDASACYLLGYETDLPPTRDIRGPLRRIIDAWQGVRHIGVRTTRPGVRLRSRRGYWPEAERNASATSSPAPTADPAADSVRGLVPRAGLALSLFAAPFRGPDGTPAIAVAIEVRDAALAAAAASGFDETLDVILVAVEPGEKVRATDRFVARRLRPRWCAACHRPIAPSWCPCSRPGAARARRSRGPSTPRPGRS